MSATKAFGQSQLPPCLLQKKASCRSLLDEVSQKNKEKNCSAMGVAGRAKKFFYPYPNPDRSARLQLKSTIPATLLANE